MNVHIRKIRIIIERIIGLQILLYLYTALFVKKQVMKITDKPQFIVDIISRILDNVGIKIQVLFIRKSKLYPEGVCLLILHKVLENYVSLYRQAGLPQIGNLSALYQPGSVKAP